MMLLPTIRARHLVKLCSFASSAEYIFAPNNSTCNNVWCCGYGWKVQGFKVVRSEPVRVALQGVKDKEVIAGELAAAEASLSATPRGAALMRK